MPLKLIPPMQPVHYDEKGVIRFYPNAIVQWLLEHGPHNMNDIARQRFSAEDREQFAQLLGYSVSGFCSLPYVTKASRLSAELKATRLRETSSVGG
jgi:hypothetical protein